MISIDRHQTDPDPDDIDGEIDRLVAEANRLAPREACSQVGAVYARYSTKSQASIVDQVRSVLEAAVKQRIHVPREHVYYDRAARGCSNRRPGLDRLRATLSRRGAVQVLLVFSTSRLARKTYRAIQIVVEDVVERGMRCIFTSSGVDTADAKRWSLLLQANALVDEATVAMASDHIRAAQEGLFEQGQVHGSVTFGYRGRDLGGPANRRGRPRRAYEIDPEAAAWVGRAFRWYVEDRLSVAEVARRLNVAAGAPRNPRLVAGWSHASVRRLLANARYAGVWEYGRFRSVWNSRKDYTAQVRRDRPLKAARWEHLRIVPDDLWHAAQVRLAERDRRGAGRKPRDGDRRSRPRALAGLFFCAGHGRVMYSGGGHGRMLVCKDCQAAPKDRRPLSSLLNRGLALKATCEALAGLVRGDAGLASAVVEACRREAAALQAPDPGRLKGLAAEATTLTSRISALMDCLGGDDRDVRESRAKLEEFRRRRASVEAELARLRAAADRPAAVPDEAAALDLLARLGAILDEAAAGDDAVENGEVRRAVDELTGGRIELHQMGGREPKRGWLQGRFRLRLPGLPAGAAANASAGPDVRVDYREPRPHEAYADEAKRLADEGLLIKAIAARLGVSRNAASRALSWWHRSRGLTPPDGRSRRSTLAPDRRSLIPPAFITLAPEAIRLSDEGLLYEEIAARLGCDRDTATKAIRYAHESRGLPAPDGRRRRKELGRYNDPHASRRPTAPAR